MYLLIDVWENKIIIWCLPDGFRHHEVVFSRDLDPGEEVGLFHHILHLPLGDGTTSSDVTLTTATCMHQTSERSTR